jgi:hypothetical protein
MKNIRTEFYVRNCAKTSNRWLTVTLMSVLGLIAQAGFGDEPVAKAATAISAGAEASDRSGGSGVSIEKIEVADPDPKKSSENRHRAWLGVATEEVSEALNAQLGLAPRRRIGRPQRGSGKSCSESGHREK